MAGNEQPGKARIYLLRREQQKEWLAEAESGDETAKLVMSAASKRMSDLATEPSGCFCCDRVFLPGKFPALLLCLFRPSVILQRLKQQRALCASNAASTMTNG
jgi:hypothetical protein